MKIGLILPGNIWYSPYVNIYTKILTENRIEFDIISWNRDGSDAPQGISFKKQLSKKNRILKLIPYLQYHFFIKRTLCENKFDKLIVFGPQLGIFLSYFLSKKYPKKYIFDYRDLSIEQYSLFKKSFHRLLNNSRLNVISSPGFKKCLPQKFEYLISHNFDIELAKKSLSEGYPNYSSIEQYTVLTIGGIRDYSSNIEIINALANNNSFTIKFVGKGGAAEKIKQYANQNNINNVIMEGYYEKKEEKDIILSSSILNIYYPRIITHSTALSNRFYSALIFKKPMIVTNNSIQGDFVEKYGLGLSLEDCKDLDSKIQNFIKNIDSEEFKNSCNKLLGVFIDDYNFFYKKIKDFIFE